MDDLVKKLTIIECLQFSCSHQLVMQIHKALEEGTAKIVTIDLDKIYYFDEDDPEKVIIRRKDLWGTYDNCRYVECKILDGELVVTLDILEQSYFRNSSRKFMIAVRFTDISSIKMFEQEINSDFEVILEHDWKQAELKRKQKWINKRKKELLKN